MSNPAAGGRSSGDARTAPGDGPGAVAIRRSSTVLPTLGLVVGLCAMVPVLVGPKVDTAQANEIADHFVPGVAVLVVSAAVLIAGRSTPLSGVAMLGAGLVITLAGLWMVATHVPLVAQAGRDEAPWGATMYHSASAVLVLGFGLVWTAASWSEAA